MGKRRRRGPKLPPTRREIERAYERQVQRRWEEAGYQDWHRKAIKQVLAIGLYRHGTCGTITELDIGLAVSLVLDPFQFGPNDAWCVGCNDLVPADECELLGGKRMHHQLRRMRRGVPLTFRLVRFLIVPLGFALVGGLVGWLGSGNPWGGVAGAAVGGLAAWFKFASAIVVSLRRRGMLWD